MSEYFRKYIKKEHYPVHYSNVKFKTLFKNVILESLRRRGWKETEGELDWDLYWADKEWIHDTMDHVHLAQNQRVNHFRNHYELTRKDLMIKNVKRQKKNLEKEGKLDEAALYDFLPMTYNLPSDYPLFLEEFKKSATNNMTWIMKPIGKSQGKGIFLFNKIQQIAQWKNNYRWTPENPQAEPYIVQKYIEKPLLVGGKKFDLRLYALVNSYQPLTIYLYRTGFARFTHHRYDNEDINNSYVHLTNVAIQKNSENYDERLGGKWELRTLKLYLISKYGEERVNESFNQIQNIIVKSNQAAQKIILNARHCFNLYGYDILFDSSLKPWLIEINASPSMTANTAHDSELKIGLLDDVFTIIDMEKVLTGQEEQIGGFDLIYKGAPIKLAANSTNSSLLGCFNNRNQQLKKLARNTAVRLAQSYEETKSTNSNPTTASTKTSTPSNMPGASIGAGGRAAAGPGLPAAKDGTTQKNIREKNILIRETKAFNKSTMGGNQPSNASAANNTTTNTTVTNYSANTTAAKLDKAKIGGAGAPPTDMKKATQPPLPVASVAAKTTKPNENPRSSQSPLEKIPGPSTLVSKVQTTTTVASLTGTKPAGLSNPVADAAKTGGINSKNDNMMKNLEDYHESDDSQEGQDGGPDDNVHNFKEGRASKLAKTNEAEDE